MSSATSPSRKSPQYLLGRRLSWISAGKDAVTNRKFSTLPEEETSVEESVTCHYTDCAIPASRHELTLYFTCEVNVTQTCIEAKGGGAAALESCELKADIVISYWLVRLTARLTVANR
jgi:hypothetical protein